MPMCISSGPTMVGSPGNSNRCRRPLPTQTCSMIHTAQPTPPTSSHHSLSPLVLNAGVMKTTALKPFSTSSIKPQMAAAPGRHTNILEENSNTSAPIQPSLSAEKSIRPRTGVKPGTRQNRVLGWAVQLYQPTDVLGCRAERGGDRSGENHERHEDMAGVGTGDRGVKILISGKLLKSLSLCNSLGGVFP